MALRMILVGLTLVAGLELPSKGEVAAWIELGRDTLATYLADRSVVPTPPVAEARGSDAAFEVAFGETMMRFASDLAESRVSETLLVSEPRAVEVREDLYEGLAYELNRFGETSVVAGDEPPPAEEFDPSLLADLAAESDLADLPATEIAPDPSPEPEPTRLERAFRLTREAADAWLSVMRDASSVSR